MAATEKKQMWFWGSSDGLPPEEVWRPIAATQGVYMAGAPFYISTSGTAKLCDTSDGSDAWHGFANIGPTAQRDANTEIRMSLIKHTHEYAVFVENGGTDAAASQSYVGIEYGLTVSATATQVGYTTLNVANSNDTVTVKDCAFNLEPYKYASTANPGVLIVTFLDAVIQAEKA